MPVRKSPNSREFCKRMELYTQDNIVFRKEDIGLMSFRGVNRKLDITVETILCLNTRVVKTVSISGS